LEEINSITDLQKKIVARLKQQLWLGQKSLAMELHGSVQATLQALAMRLSQKLEPSPKELEEILQAVRRSLERIENMDYLNGQEFKSLLAELKTLWAGTAEISWTKTDSARRLLRLDQGLARCAFELIRESVTNAIKHGEADQIMIQIDADTDTLHLRITNNGFLSNKNQASVGSMLFDQLCTTHSIREQDGKTIIDAELSSSPAFLKEVPVV
jgi:signal transduction histidine kinase